MIEYRDLYDKDRNLTGDAIKKGDPIPEGLYIIVVLVYIENSEGKFLIQRRSRKYKDGKLATTGGHVKTGTTSIQGIMEEVEEEIGLKTSPSDYTLYYSGQTNDVFFDDYYMKLDVDLSTLVLDDLEVDEVCWMTPEEIYAAVASGDYLAEDVEEFDRLLEWKKNQESLS